MAAQSNRQFCYQDFPMHLNNIETSYRVLCLATMLLSACGGGGGGGSSSGAAPGTTTVHSAYVANYGSNNISQYTIDATTGALTPKATPTVTSGAGPTSVTVDPTGKYAYVANSFGIEISQYTIGAGGGLVAMIPAATAPAGSAPISIAIDPSGKYAYAANSGDNTVSQFTIAAGGGLVPMTSAATAPSGTWPVSIVVDAKSQYAYVANQSGNSISQYNIGTGGALTPMSPAATVATGTSPVSVAVAGDSTGSKYVYVANNGSADVWEYSIGTGGALSRIGTIAAGNLGGTASLPTAITVAGDSTGSKYVYVTNGAVVSQYTINSNGTLAAMTNPTIPAGITAQSVTVDTTGKYVYVANLNGSFSGFPSGTGTVSQYSIGAGGELTAMSILAVVSGGVGSQPYSVTTAVTIQ